MNNCSSFPLVKGFLDFLTKSPPNIENNINVQTLQELNAPCVSNFKSLNQEFVWSENHEGWVKGKQQPILYQSLPEKLKASDEKFLVLLTHLAISELKSNPVSLNQLKKIEMGIDATYFSTTTPGGEFIDIRLFIMFQEGRVVFARKNNRFHIKLNRLIASDTTPKCLDSIRTEFLDSMISFIASQPLIWMQFSAPRNPFLSRSQKFSLLLFKNIAQRDLIHNANRLILLTSFFKFRKKYFAKSPS